MTVDEGCLWPRCLPPRTDAPDPNVLTGRQKEVLALLAEGYRNEGIAERLGIRPSTVKTTLAHAYRRIGARNGNHAAALAERMGLTRTGGKDK